jgi:hypothetical protein
MAGAKPGRMLGSRQRHRGKVGLDASAKADHSFSETMKTARRLGLAAEALRVANLAQDYFGE